MLRLELRNEALETHFINHLEILDARHAAGLLPELAARGYRFVTLSELAR